MARAGTSRAGYSFASGPAGRDGTDGRSLTLRGDWNGSDLYETGDLAWHNGLLYMSLENNSGIAPEGDPRWRLLTIVGAPGEVTTQQLTDAISGAIAGTANNVNGISPVELSPSDPVEVQLQTLKDRFNELVNGLHR